MTVTPTERHTTSEPVGFADVNVGDTLTFFTRDNGYGGTGNSVRREGVVTSKTAKSVTLRVVGENPFRENVFRNGKGHELGRTARIRRNDWGSRIGGRTANVEKLPYDAEHAIYADHGHSVDAMWTPSPEQAKDPNGINILDRANECVEMIATIERRYKADGYNESGWFIRPAGYGWDYAGANKREAMKALRAAVADYFSR